MTIKKYPQGKDGSTAIMFADGRFADPQYGFVVKDGRVTHFITHMNADQFRKIDAVTGLLGAKTNFSKAAEGLKPITIGRHRYNAKPLGDKGMTLEAVAKTISAVEPTLLAALREHMETPPAAAQTR